MNCFKIIVVRILRIFCPGYKKEYQPVLKKCDHCGANIYKEEKYCEACGKKIDSP